METLPTLYEVKNMKGKNSIWKSVVLSDIRYDNRPVVQVEPYDDTFLNAIATVKKYDKTVDRIIDKIWEYYKGEEVIIQFFTEWGHMEIELSDFYMNEIRNDLK